MSNPTPCAPKHFLRLLDLTPDQARQLLQRAVELKHGPQDVKPLAGKTVALLFEKASTRTRVSFDVGVAQLGGRTVFMTPAESQLGRNEPLKDTARVLSRYVDCLVVRTFGQDKLEELARYASVPVVNALTDTYHPCQVLSDVLTMAEHSASPDDLVVAWLGDGNNMAHSWIAAAALFPFTVRLACPEGYDPDPGIVAEAQGRGAKVELGRDPAWAVRGAHFVNTDVWASMGQEHEQDGRAKVFAPYQVNATLMALAAPEARFMHCLPAHRGEEVTEEVFESPASIVWDQAENRLHMQKAILEWLFTPDSGC